MLEAGSYELHPESVDVAGAIRDMVEPLRPRAKAKGLDLVLEMEPTHIEGQVDMRCLEDIVTNLVDNAVKFTEEGKINIEVREEDGDVRLRMEDTGQGIEGSFLPEAFDTFAQESSGLDRSHEGMGVGLSVTRRLVDILGGQIQIESEKGGGTTVTVRFPRRQTALRIDKPVGPVPDG